MDLEGGTLAMASVQKILEIKSYIRLRITAEADLGLHISSEDTSYPVIFLPAHPESCTHIFALGLTF